MPATASSGAGQTPPQLAGAPGTLSLPSTVALPPTSIWPRPVTAAWMSMSVAWVRTSVPTSRRASTPPGPVRCPSERSRYTASFSLVTVRVYETVPPSAVVPSSTSSPTAPAPSVDASQLTIVVCTPASAASNASAAKALFRPPRCSSRPAKKVPPTSAPMMTRAKMATASAMPRSSESFGPRMTVSRYGSEGRRVTKTDARRETVLADGECFHADRDGTVGLPPERDVEGPHVGHRRGLGAGAVAVGEDQAVRGERAEHGLGGVLAAAHRARAEPPAAVGLVEAHLHVLEAADRHLDEDRGERRPGDRGVVGAGDREHRRGVAVGAGPRGGGRDQQLEPGVVEAGDLVAVHEEVEPVPTAGDDGPVAERELVPERHLGAGDGAGDTGRPHGAVLDLVRQRDHQVGRAQLAQLGREQGHAGAQVSLQRDPLALRAGAALHVHHHARHDAADDAEQHEGDHQLDEREAAAGVPGCSRHGHSHRMIVLSATVLVPFATL